MLNQNLIDKVQQIRTTLNEISVYNLDVKTSLELYYELAKKVNEVINELIGFEGDVVEEVKNFETTVNNEITRFENLVSEDLRQQNEKITYMLNEGLKLEVGFKIDDLIQDGTMDSLINHKIFNDLNTKIETYKQQTDEQFNTIMHINEYKSIAKYNYMKFKLKLKQNTESIIGVTQGDSLTFGEDLNSTDKRTHTSDATHENGSGTTTIASKTYPEALRDSLGWSLNRLPIIKKRAVGGATVLSSYNQWTTNPHADVHILMFGHNDSSYYEINDFIDNYLKLIYRILDWGSAVVLLTPPPMQNFNEKLQTFRQTVFEIGEILGIEVFDTKEFIEGYANEKIHQVTNSEIVDGVHFNGDGYSLIGYGVASKLLTYNALNVNSKSNISVNPWNYYLNGSTYLPLSLNDRYIDIGDKENTGRCINITSGDNIVININVVEENLCLIPVIQGDSNSQVVIQLNYNSPLTKYELTKEYESIGYSKSLVFEKGTVMLKDKAFFTKDDINKKVLRVYKGFNSIKVSNVGTGDNSSVNLHGFYVCSINELLKENLTVNGVDSIAISSNRTEKIEDKVYLDLTIFNIDSLSYNKHIATINQNIGSKTLSCVMRDSEWKTKPCLITINEEGKIIYMNNDTLEGLTPPYAIYLNAIL